MKNKSLIKIMLIAFALLGIIIVFAAISTLGGNETETTDTVKSADGQDIYNLLVLDLQLHWQVAMALQLEYHGGL